MEGGVDEGKRCGHETPRTKWWALPPRPGPARTLSRALKDSPNLAASNHAVELHIDPASLVDVVIHPSALPHGTTPGDIIAIRPRHIGKGKAKDCPLLYKVDKVDDDGPGKVRRSKAPVVVNQTVASTFGWAKNRTEVVLTLVPAPPPPHFTATHVELYFSNIYLGRPDMLRLALSLCQSVLYLNQRVVLPGSVARLRVGGIYSEGKTAKSAWIDEDTKVIFRSESARCYVFVEVSQEMWHFEEDGSMLREKCEVFLSELFMHWTGRGTGGIDSKSKGQLTSHTVSIILYGRVIYEDNGEGEEARAPLSRDEDGVLYRDFYKVILDLTPSPPPSIVRTVSSEIRRWQEEVLLRRRPSGELKLAGRIAFAHESNMLEAVNLALNSFEEHWIDRDLQRTGLSLIVLSAGTSFYSVPKSLLRLTTDRMLCHGIGLDLISLSKTPLHTVPLFSFRSHEPGLLDESLRQTSSNPNGTPSAAPTTSEALMKEATRVSLPLPDDQRDPLYYDSPNPSQETSVYYSEPPWVFCSFFGSQIDKPHRIDRFMPRARCYELFSQGIGDRIPIAIPLLLSNAPGWEKDEEGWSRLNEAEKRQARRDRYDALAVGAKPGADEWSAWERRSGATSGTSGGMMSGVSAVEEERGVRGARGRKTEEGRGRAASVSVAEVERAREHRAEKRVEEREWDRNRTPTGIGRVQRSPSMAASIRTISSSKAKSTTKTATPALIARLTAPPPPATSSGASTGGRQSWLGLFRPGHGGPSTAPAPSVAVQRVDVQANTSADFDLDSGASVTSHPPSRATSPSSSSRRSSSTAPSRPTQPISISTRTTQTREADRPTKRIQGSLEPPKFAGPVIDAHPKQTFESRFNPSKPGKRSIGLADQARRWASIFIRHSNDQRAVNWISITRGACLPITTDFLPTAAAQATQFSDHRYSIPLVNTSHSFLLRTDNARRSPALELVTELMSQRLSQGFQICTPSDPIGALDEINVVTSKTLPQVLRDVHDGELTPIYLSLANQIHRISYDRRTQSVTVKILRRRRTWMKTDYTYGALIWTQGAKAYGHLDLTFPYPDLMDPPDWQHLDRLVAGLETPDLRPTLRYWRTRLVLLPADKVPDRDFLVKGNSVFEEDPSDEEINLQGFFTLMSTLQSARWLPSHVETAEPTPTEITQLSPAEWASATARAQSSHPAQEASGGVVQQRSSRWLRRVTGSTPREESLMADRSRSLSPTRTDSTPPKPRPTVQMSHSVILDLDPQKKSPRAERVLCHFDRSHNPQAAYHIELTWLAGSGKIIDAAIQSWARLGARYGLSLIEVSTRSALSRHNPFQEATKVPLALPPPSLDDTRLPQHYYEAELLRHLDFFLDIGADSTFPADIDVQYSYRRIGSTYSQYIHRNGTLLVSILGGAEGFVFVPNRIYISHSQNRPDEIVEQLVRLCGDAEALGALWTTLTLVEEEEEMGWAGGVVN